MFIGDYLAKRAMYTPLQEAFVDTGKQPTLRLNYTQANQRANRLAHWLREQGVVKGDRIAILAKDGVEHLDLFFACGKIGAVHTALNWRLHWRETAQILQNVEPNVLFFSDDFREDVNAIRETVPLTCVHLEGAGIENSYVYEDILHIPTDASITCPTLVEEDIAALIFTGGTTGLPKAAQVSHRMIAWNTLNTVIHDLRHHDTYLNVFPLFHTGGLFVYTVPQVILGGRVILVRQFDPARVLSLIETESVTVFAGVPTMYQLLSQAPNWKDADLSSLRFCTSGGAPLPAPLVEHYTREKQIRFKQGFGMTEFGPGLFALPPEEAVRKAGSIGRPNFFVDARVVNDEHQPLGPHQEGELIIKGPSFCSGYYNNPTATRAAIDSDGYFHTGDVAKYDEEGYFYIVDRKKDMFISGGENVYPAEIERALYAHPSVLQCAVIGVPNPKWGEVGKACVVLKPGADVPESAMLTFLHERLAKYKVPKSVAFLDSLPLSGAGKILKRELRARYST